MFLGRQEQLISTLSTSRENILHPGTKGDVTELKWIEVLQIYLPERYRVASAFVLDSQGHLSEQIDVVVFDRHYSPFLFKEETALYIPAESVYAALEVKQDLAKDSIEYAAGKVASVRRLYRTSAPIPHAGGVFDPKEPFDIIAGLLTLGSQWSPAFGESFESAIRSLAAHERIDLGCTLQHGSFDIMYGEKDELRITKSEREESLIFFLLRLLARLQQLATAPAIDITAYQKSLRQRT